MTTSEHTTVGYRYPRVVLTDQLRGRRDEIESVTMLPDCDVSVDGCEWQPGTGISFDFQPDGDATVTFRFPAEIVQTMPAEGFYIHRMFSVGTPHPYVELAWRGEPFLSRVVGCRIDGIPRPPTKVTSVALRDGTYVDIEMRLGSLEMR